MEEITSLQMLSRGSGDFQATSAEPTAGMADSELMVGVFALKGGADERGVSASTQRCKVSPEECHTKLGLKTSQGP